MLESFISRPEEFQSKKFSALLLQVNKLVKAELKLDLIQLTKLCHGRTGLLILRGFLMPLIHFISRVNALDP